MFRLLLLHWAFCVKIIEYILGDLFLYLVIVSAKLEINMQRLFRQSSMVSILCKMKRNFVWSQSHLMEKLDEGQHLFSSRSSVNCHFNPPFILSFTHLNF